MSNDFPDHFSAHADAYAASRPADYPQELIHFLADAAPAHDLAWDAATGNGQAAICLAERFERVIATDASAEQLAQARRHPRIEYRQAVSEQTDFEDGRVALTTVAQGLHWFDFERFFAEVRRVSRPHAIFAAWTYDMARIEPAVDAEIDKLAKRTVGPYWPPERIWVDKRYETLPFPFEEIAAPSFEMTADWSLDRYLAYVRTWSAVKRFEKQNGSNPVDTALPAFERAWGDPATKREIHWPIYLRVGRVG